MVAELEHTKVELQEYISLSNKLQAELEAVKHQMAEQTGFLTRQVDLATNRANILDSTLTMFRTNYKTIRETFVRCETEALEAGLAVLDKPPEKPIDKPAEKKADGAVPELLDALADLVQGPPPRLGLAPN